MITRVFGVVFMFIAQMTGQITHLLLLLLLILMVKRLIISPTINNSNIDVGLMKAPLKNLDITK